MKKTLIISGVVLSVFSVNAQSFNLSGEIRPRTEYRHGFGSVADSAQKPAIFTEQRSRLYFGHKSENIHTQITIQDVRVWGNQPNTINNDGALTSIHEAWTEAFINKKLSMKFGRQQIAYDDDRIFGTLDWAQQARRHDAVVFKYQDSSFVFHVGGTYNQDKVQNNSTYYTTSNYKALQYMWFHKEMGALELSVLFLNNGLQASRYDSTSKAYIYKDNYSQTAGARLAYKKDKLSGFAYYYQQFGVSGDWANTKINAYDAALEVGYLVTVPIKVSVGFEMLSGNDFTDKSNLDTTSLSKVVTQKAFNPFYGTNHKFNGYMDQFYVGNHVGNVGLNDVYLKLDYKHEKFNIGLNTHFFMANGKMRDSKKYNEDVTAALKASQNWKDVGIPAMSSNLGTELDFHFGFNLVKGVSVKGGYSHLLPSETLAIIKGVKDFNGIGRTDQINNWGWLMIIVKPTFLAQALK